jgi:transcriptional regulator with XRE-family HTH domain
MINETYERLTIGEAIRNLRKRCINDNGTSMSQEDLSFRVGWDNASTLSRIENGLVIPNRDTIKKISDGLGLSKEEFSILDLKLISFNEKGMLRENIGMKY